MDSIPAGQRPANARPQGDPLRPSQVNAPHDAPPPPTPPPPPPPPPGSDHAAFQAGRTARRQILRAFRAA
eukprot:9276981-Lingulodinium_polyedra.AAC.1